MQGSRKHVVDRSLKVIKVDTAVLFLLCDSNFCINCIVDVYYNRLHSVLVCDASC